MQIGMLGTFEVRTVDGDLAEVPGARLRALVVALALRPGQVVPKASLIDWIWGEQPPADAANALQRLVSRLRKVLPDGVIEGGSDGYRLAVRPDEVDAVRFERLVSAGQAAAEDTSRRVGLLREAAALWRGDAMQDVGLQESGAFDAVVVRLEGLRLTAAEERFDAELTLGHGADLVTELGDLVAAHPLRERLVAALMRALAAAGRDSDALQLYQRTREALADALGVDPSPELSAIHVALLRGQLGRREESRKTNLRAELTSFVGRGEAVTAVRGLIAGHRLTTVIGPGGAGKTRLAVETARTLLGDLPDGAWLVELAAIGADGDVAQSALAAFGLRDALLGSSQSADMTERLIAAIRDRDALLILDNCEHVIESAAVFAHRVLGECRRLRILATSREPLGITGEALWPVEPLALPGSDASPAQIESSPAVQLLRDRADAVRRDLGADARTLATMLRVCRALDGLPLAIELAAARLRTMSVEQLANRLDDRFRLLTGGSRTALPRHRTLRAVVDWSWELLTEAERTALRRLAAFSGGASLEAAERVCALDGVGGLGAAVDDAADAIEQEQVLELLTALTEKSLLLADGEGAPRYRMSGTIKEYAEQRLADAGETDLARRAHLAYFIELAETAEPHLRRADQVEWLAILGAEHDNIGAAMRGALAAGEALAAMRLAAGGGWYWWLGGRRAEGIELLIAATEVPDGAPGDASGTVPDEASGAVPDKLKATVYALIVLFVSSGRSDEHQAAEWIHKAYRYSRDIRSSDARIGFVAALEQMLQAPETVLSAFESLLDHEDPWVRALARAQLGKMRIVFGQGGEDADAFLETALTEFRALGERYGMYFALTELAARLATRGEFGRACGYYEQAITAVSELGAVEDIIRMRSIQAQLYWLLGDERSSATSLVEARRCAEGVAWPDALAELALAAAELARWQGDAEEARRQLDIATTLLGEDGQHAHIRAVTQDLLGYLTEDLAESGAHRAAACAAAAEAGHAQIIALVLIGVADLALRQDEPMAAARLLAASEGVRGLPDLSHPDAVRIDQTTRSRLGDAKVAEAAVEGTRTDWSKLAEVTLAS